MYLSYQRQNLFKREFDHRMGLIGTRTALSRSVPLGRPKIAHVDEKMIRRTSVSALRSSRFNRWKYCCEILGGSRIDSARVIRCEMHHASGRVLGKRKPRFARGRLAHPE